MESSTRQLWIKSDWAGFTVKLLLNCKTNLLYAKQKNSFSKSIHIVSSRHHEWTIPGDIPGLDAPISWVLAQSREQTKQNVSEVFTNLTHSNVSEKI